jgi:hypothetical protein
MNGIVIVVTALESALLNATHKHEAAQAARISTQASLIPTDRFLMAAT